MPTRERWQPTCGAGYAANRCCACRVGPMGTLWRRCQRRPAQTALAASLMMTVVVGFGGVTWQWRRADVARASAVDALNQSMQTLATLNQVTMSRVSMTLDPLYDREQLRTVLLDHYRNALPKWRNDPALLPELAKESCQVAQLIQETGSLDAACSAWKEAEDLIERTLRFDSKNLYFRCWLASSIAHRGRLLRNAGHLREGNDILDRALESWRQAISVAQQRLGAAKDEPDARRILADGEVQQGQLDLELGRRDLARAAFERSFQIAERLIRTTPDLTGAKWTHATALVALAGMAWADRPEEAGVLRRRAIDRYSELLREHSGGEARSSELMFADGLFSLAVAEDRHDRDDEALADFEGAAGIYQELWKFAMVDRGRDIRRAVCYHVMGRIHADHGRPARAVDCLKKAVEVRERLVSQNPRDINARCCVVGSWFRLAEALLSLGKIGEAVDSYQKCLAHQRLVYSQEPTEPKHREFLEARLRQMFWLMDAMGRPADAIALTRERRRRWPRELAVALGVASDLAAAVAWPRRCETSLAAILGTVRSPYASEALATARDAATLAREICQNNGGLASSISRNH